MEEWLGRPCMWYGCRHHVAELLAKDAWYAVFEDDLSPTNSFFESVKSAWDQLDTGSTAKINTLEGDIFMKEQALTFYKDVLNKKNKKNECLLRDDYRELVETAMAILGNTSPNSWKKCGATQY